MILQSETALDLMAVALWSGICFALGVGWAAYRAVGWVERMRAWAYSVQVEGNETDMPTLVGATEGEPS